MGRRRKRRPHERDVHGILLLDKPAGITSNDALQRIKRLYRAARAGHTGSLDKPATGMLPLCLGEATKVSSSTHTTMCSLEIKSRCLSESKLHALFNINKVSGLIDHGQRI